MKTVVVIPAYNEENAVVDAIKDAALFSDAVVVVDDASHDDTEDRAYSAGAYVLKHVINRGQGAAIQTGTDYAVNVLNADIIVHFDADGQMQAKEIPGLVEKIKTDEVDIVLGSRFIGKTKGMPLARRITLKMALLVTLILSGIKLTDTHNGFRALSRETAQKINIRMDRMAHASELIDYIRVYKLRYAEHPVTIFYTEQSLKKGSRFSGGFTIIKDFFKGKFFDEI